MAHRLHYMDNHMTLGRGSREQAQGDSGHGKDVAWSPLYPTALAAKSNTPPATQTPAQIQGGSWSLTAPGNTAPDHPHLLCALPPPWAGAMKPSYSSWGCSPMAQADPAHLPGLASAYQSECKFPFSSPPGCNMQLGKLRPSGAEPAIPTSFPLPVPVASVLPDNEKPQHLSH